MNPLDMTNKKPLHCCKGCVLSDVLFTSLVFLYSEFSTIRKLQHDLCWLWSVLWWGV